MEATENITEQVRALLGGRADRVEAQRPGAIAAGIEQAAREAKTPEEIAPLAVIRALQTAGSRPTREDELLWLDAGGRAA